MKPRMVKSNDRAYAGRKERQRMKAQRLDREKLLKKLERIKYEPGDKSGDDQLRQMNME